MTPQKFNKLLGKLRTNSKAFTELYTFYFPKIVIYIFTKYRNKHLGEDVAQEFFTKQLKRINETYIEYPNAWIYTCCDNIAKDFLTAQKEYELAYNITNKNGNDNMDFFENINNEYIEKLNLLDSETRQIIIMFVCQGYGLNEIAIEMSLNYSTVRSKYRRGIKKLKTF